MGKAVAEATSQENIQDVLSLFLKCTAVKMGKYVPSSKESRFFTTLVKVQTAEDTTFLAEMQYYAKCTAIHDHSASTSLSSKKQEVWIAGVSLFLLCTLVKCGMANHVKFGLPCPSSSDLLFVPISSIVTRVAYCKCSVDYGQLIATDHIFVVSPIH